MAHKKRIAPGKQLRLQLTAAERKLVLDELIVTGMEYEQLLRGTCASQPVMMTLDELDDFGGYIAAEANHCQDKRKAKKLDAIFEKIQGLLDNVTDDDPPQSVKIEAARKDKVLSDQALQIAEFAGKQVVAAEQSGVKTKQLDEFWLAPAQREVLLLIPGMTPALKQKLAKDRARFTVSDVASMTMALAEDLPDGDARKQLAVLYLAKHLMDHLQSGIVALAQPQTSKKPTRRSKVARDTLLQFKITLLGVSPPVWRRIQVQDGTLDALHEHIQTAMGWTNSHLHQFEVNGQRYSDPDLIVDDFDEFEYVDSTRTMVSEILPKTGKRFAFKYEYDFGDSWQHEVLFEGYPPSEKQKKYPLCLEGKRACPPEDVGGTSGYEDFLAAIADPQHEEHEEFLRWCGGKFSPEEFDAAKATRRMRNGLPNWRPM